MIMSQLEIGKQSNSGTQHINISSIADDRVEFVDAPLTPAFNGAAAGDIAVLQNK